MNRPLLLLAVLAGCNFGPEKEATPCEQWQAAVATCAEQASVISGDSGLGLDSGIPGAENYVQTARCGENSDDDPDWMQELYTCWVNVYDNTDCSDRAQLVDLSIQIADCAITNGGQ